MRKSEILDLFWFLVLSAFMFLMAPLFPAHGATLAWDASAGADGYKIYYQPQAGGDQHSVLVENGTQVDVSELHLLPGVTYAIYATAYNSAGESGPSNTVVYTPAAFVPDENPAPLVVVMPGPVTISISGGK